MSHQRPCRVAQNTLTILEIAHASVTIILAYFNRMSSNSEQEAQVLHTWEKSHVLLWSLEVSQLMGMGVPAAIDKEVVKQTRTRKQLSHLISPLPKTKINTTKECNSLIDHDKLLMVRPEKGTADCMVRMSLHYEDDHPS